MYRARADYGHAELEAYGNTAEEARAFLLAGWQSIAAVHGQPVPWEDVEQSLWVYPVRVGDCYRTGGVVELARLSPGGYENLSHVVQ